MSKKDQFLENAHRCIAIADQLEGSLSALTLRQAAESWVMLAELEHRSARQLCAERAAGSAPQPSQD